MCWRKYRNKELENIEYLIGKQDDAFIFMYLLYFTTLSNHIFLCVTMLSTYLGNIDSLWPLYNSLSNLTFHINLSPVRIKVNPLPSVFSYFS